MHQNGNLAKFGNLKLSKNFEFPVFYDPVSLFYDHGTRILVKTVIGP